MILLPQTIIDIVAAGGGIIIDLNKQIILPETMLDIAAVAAHSGAKVTFRIGSKIIPPQTMLDIAAVGRGNVTFDIS